jgi:hypothetical protein
MSGNPAPKRGSTGKTPKAAKGLEMLSTTKGTTAEQDMEEAQRTIVTQASEVTNTIEAIAFLIKKKHIVNANECTLVNLAYILLNASIATTTGLNTRSVIDNNNLI